MLYHQDTSRRQSNSSDTTATPCYFTLTPSAYSHYSIETPCASPSSNAYDSTVEAEIYNPLLAYRPVSPSLSSTMASTMQLQTSIAHPTRPRPVPVQNVLQVTSDDSTNSDDSARSSYDVMRSDSHSSCLSTARCSRCQRTPSLDPNTGGSNMMQYGLNLWYCVRCAGIVGMGKR